MNKTTKKKEGNVNAVFSEWRGLWYLVDHEGKSFTKDQLYRLAMVDKTVRNYQQVGLLEDFTPRPNIINRSVFTDEYLRKARLNNHGKSILKFVYNNLKNLELKDSLIDEHIRMEKIYEHYYQNKYDSNLNEQMIDKNMKLLEPLMLERAELWGLIKRGCPVDSYDIQRLVQIERMRDKLLVPESEEQRLRFMQLNDDYLVANEDKMFNMNDYKESKNKDTKSNFSFQQSINKSRDVKAFER